MIGLCSAGRGQAGRTKSGGELFGKRCSWLRLLPAKDPRTKIQDPKKSPKHKAPRTKIQDPKKSPKHKAPRTKLQRAMRIGPRMRRWCLCLELGFGDCSVIYWILVIGSSLDLGCWILDLLSGLPQKTFQSVRCLHLSSKKPRHQVSYKQNTMFLLRAN